MGANPHSIVSSSLPSVLALLNKDAVLNVLQDVPVVQAHRIGSKLRQGLPRGLPGPSLDLVLRDASQLPDGVSSISELYQLVQRHRNFYFSVVAMFALVLYDYLLTLELEVEFIWMSKSRFSATNFLFFSNRYIPIIRSGVYLVFSLFPPHSNDVCGRFTDLNSWLSMLSMANVEILMLTRAWTLYGKSRKIGFLMIGVWIASVMACGYVIRSPLSFIPGVVPLEPQEIDSCDRPNPYKYLVSYVLGLFLELFSFSMMMGRIAFLSRRTKVTNVSRRTAALPILRSLQRHGAYYFALVIFSMAFTAGSAFSKPLARIVINGGMALTLTSIACNRVIFAFRGLLTEFNEGQSRSRPNPPPSHRGKFVDDTNRTQEENGVFTTDAEALDDEYIAYTRHDMTTRELVSRDDSQSESTSRKVPASPLSIRSDEPSTMQVSWRAEKNRPRRFEFPFRSHQASTSTDLTRESIPEGGTGTTESGRLARPEMQRPSVPSLNSQTPLNPISPATDAVTTPTTDSSSRFAKPLLSPTSLKSMARSALRSPPTSPSSQVFNMPISESISDGGGGGKSHQGSGSVSFSTSPVSAEHVRRTISSSGTKRHSFWWNRPGSKGSVGADALSIAERAGVGHDAENRDGSDVVGNAGDDRMMEITLRPRGRERHPLDHQYEMDTLYTDPIDRVLDDD